MNFIVFGRFNRSLRLPFACLALAAGCGIFTPTGAVAQVTWNGAASSDWSGANWTNGSLANNFSSAVTFAGSTRPSTTNDLTSGTISHLTFNSGAAAFTLAGNSITLTGTIGNQSTNPQTISLPIVLSSATHAINTVANGSLTISGNISGGNTTAGTNSIVVNTASGTLTLSGSNTYVGATDLRSGVLIVGSANALGSGTLRWQATNGPLLDVPSGQAFNITNGIGLVGGSGTFVGSGNGSIVSSGTLSFTGANRTLTVASGTIGVAMLSTDSAANNFTKSGAGTLLITGSSDATFGNTNTAPVGSFRHTGGVVVIGNNKTLGSGTYVSGNDSNVLRAYNADLTAIPNTILLATNTTTFDGSYSLAFTGTVIQDASRFIVNLVPAGKLLTFSGTTVLGTAGGRRLYVAGTGTTVFSGPVTDTGLTSSGTIGVGGVYFNGATAASGTGGILVLSASNSHTGGVAIETRGLLLINHPQALGSGSLAFNGTGAFDNVTGSPITVNNGIRMVSASGTFVGSNNSTFVTTGQLYWTGSNRQLTVANSGTVEVGSLGSDGNVNSRFIKEGNTGTLIINNAADVSVTGTIRLAGGTLIVGNGAALGSGTFEYASSAANFQGKSADLTIANPVYLNSSTATFSGPQGLTFTGTMALQNTDAGNPLGREITNNVAAGKSLTFNGTTSLLNQTGTARMLTIAGSGNTVFGGPIIDGGADPLGFRQNSTGTTTLSAVNTYSGTTSVLQGTLVIGNAAGLGGGSARLAVSGGVLDLGGFTVTRTGSVTFTGGTTRNGTLSNDTIAFDAQAGTVSAVLTGSAGLTKTTTGTVTLSNANTYSGTTTVSAGRLIAGNAAAFGSGVIEVNGGVLDLGGQSMTNAITFYGSGGSVTNAAGYAGTQTLNALAIYSGSVGGTVNVAAGGTLQGNAVTFTGPVTIGDGAVHAPGTSPGLQTFTGGLAYTGSSALQWELVANTDTAGDAGTLYDSVSVTGGDLTITSGAALQMVFNGVGSAVNWSDAFWNSSHSWTVINFSGGGSSTGNFTIAGDNTTWTDSLSQSLVSQRPYAYFEVQNSSNNLVLNYAVPEPATWALAGIGGCGAGLMALRRRRRRTRTARARG